MYRVSSECTIYNAYTTNSISRSKLGKLLFWLTPLEAGVVAEITCPAGAPLGAYLAPSIFMSKTIVPCSVSEEFLRSNLRCFNERARAYIVL